TRGRLAIRLERRHHLLEQPSRGLRADVARIAGERRVLEGLLHPGEPTGPELDVQPGALGPFLPELDQRSSAVRGPQRRALAVRAHLQVAGAARAQTVDRDLRQAAAREIERDELDRVGL